MPVNMPLNNDTIGLIRRGSDIDVEAIFGGNIAGRRLTGVKINPLFLEGQSEEDVRQTESLGRNGYHTRDPSIRLDVYDLRSPAHSVNGENGKRQTIVKIGRHEIVSVSTTKGAHSTTQGEITVTTTTAPTDNVDAAEQRNMDVNTDSLQGSYVNVQAGESTAFVSVLTDPTPPCPNPEHASLGGPDCTSPEALYDNVPDTRDVREVVVSFSEGADKPVMDTPSEQTDWPDVSSPNKLGVVEETGLCPTANSNGQNNGVSQGEQSSNTSSPQVRTLKPILVRSQSSFDSVLSSAGLSFRQDEGGKEPPKSTNTKTVKFAEDTIDNENKTKRYMKERIDLSKLYNGKIVVENAYGTVNPVFVEEDDTEKVNNNHTELPRYEQLPDLNIPSYMQKYLVDDTPNKSVSEGTKDSPYSPSHTTTVAEPVESEESPGDTSQDTEISEVPGYEALVLKTAAQERRKQAIKWTVIAVVVVVVLIMAIALPVYFTTKDS